MVQEKDVMADIQGLKKKGVDEGTIIKRLAAKFRIRRSDIAYMLWELNYCKAPWEERKID